MSPNVAAKATSPYALKTGQRPDPARIAEAIHQLVDWLNTPALHPASEVPALAQQVPIQQPEVGGKELARAITGLSFSRIYALVSQRGIPHAKRGNRLFFYRADLLAWVAEGNRAERKQNGR